MRIRWKLLILLLVLSLAPILAIRWNDQRSMEKMGDDLATTTRSVLELARRHNVEMPIVAGVASVLFEGQRPADAIEELMTRRLHGESSK